MKNQFTDLFYYNKYFEEFLSTYYLKELKENRLSSVENEKVQQELVALLYSDLLYAYSESNMTPKAFFGQYKTQKLKRICKIDFQKYTLKISLIVYLKKIYSAFRCIKRLIRSVFRKQLVNIEKFRTFTLVMDDLFLEQRFKQTEDLTDFYNFFDSTFGDSISTNRCNIICSSFFSGHALNNYYFSSSPIYDLSIFLPQSKALVCALKSICQLLILIPRCTFNPRLLLIIDDLVDQIYLSQVTRYLEIREIIVTNSKYNTQPLCLKQSLTKKYKSSMLWYSANAKWFKYKQAPDNYTFNPMFKNIDVDNHYVWNEDQCLWLKDVVGLKASYEIIGPVTFRPKYILPIEARKSHFNIFLFDVAPFANGKNQKSVYGNSYVYYSLENCRSFLGDIVDAFQKYSNVTIHLKNKRKYTSYHSAEYLHFIEELGASQKIVLHDESLDAAKLIAEQADLVFSIPYTSVFYIADHYGVNSGYYDPSGKLELNYSLGKKGFFVQGKKSLVSFADSYMESLKNDAKNS
ncbi:MAG: hypothetical protein CME71_12730 [Halobacteriovorax sp.]|nr:hypothetical protein [Halobacteriovorax sp.]